MLREFCITHPEILPEMTKMRFKFLKRPARKLNNQLKLLINFSICRVGSGLHSCVFEWGQACIVAYSSGVRLALLRLLSNKRNTASLTPTVRASLTPPVLKLFQKTD